MIDEPGSEDRAPCLVTLVFLPFPWVGHETVAFGPESQILPGPEAFALT